MDYYRDIVFVFKQKTAYEMRISDWSSDVCSSDLGRCLYRVEELIGARHGQGSEEEQQGSPKTEEGSEEDHRRQALHQGRAGQGLMAEHFVRNRQPWNSEEAAKLRTLAGKGMALKAIATALTPREQTGQEREKIAGRQENER